MIEQKRKAVLNRAIFVQRPLDSSALTALTSLFYIMSEVGDYEIFIRSGEKVVRRTTVKVMAEIAPSQTDMDLAKPGESAPGCTDDQPLTLGKNSVVAFYTSQGVQAYTVTITQLGPEKKVVHLDSATAIPENSLFAVTLVRPGIYSAVNTLGRGKAQIMVSLPVGERYRVDQPTVVESKKARFSQEEIQILSGQTVVFRCLDAARIRIELVKADDRVEIPPERKRLTLHKHQPRG